MHCGTSDIFVGPFQYSLGAECIVKYYTVKTINSMTAVEQLGNEYTEFFFFFCAECLNCGTYEEEMSSVSESVEFGGLFFVFLLTIDVRLLEFQCCVCRPAASLPGPDRPSFSPSRRNSMTSSAKIWTK